MVFATRILKKTVGEDNEKTEMFMTANRSVRTGLTASAMVSVFVARIYLADEIHTLAIVLVVEHYDAWFFPCGIQ
jgi:hypothetical protein